MLFGYCCGITSSQVAKHCQEDVVFRVLATNNQPDHRTIGDFRTRHLKALEHVFKDDIQRVQAQSHELRPDERRYQATHAREEAQYGKEKWGDELPKELTRREIRLATIKAAKRALEEEAKLWPTQVKTPFCSLDPHGTVKTEPCAEGTERVADSAQRNFADPRPRIMPHQKSFAQVCNNQVAVDSTHRIIVATDLSNHPKDEDLLSISYGACH